MPPIEFNNNNSKSKTIPNEVDPLQGVPRGSVTQMEIINKSNKLVSKSINNGKHKPQSKNVPKLSKHQQQMSYYNLSSVNPQQAASLNFPAPKIEQIDEQKALKPTIANFGTEIDNRLTNLNTHNNSNNNNNRLTGFVKNIISRGRKTSSADQNDSNNSNISRNKSPNFKINRKRNISVANMPKSQRDKIAKRLNGLKSKKELQKELENSMLKLQKKLKHHATRVMNYKDELRKIGLLYNDELSKWKEWYIIDLIDYGEEYYKNKINYLKNQIELERLHIECFTEKLTKLESASKAIKKAGIIIIIYYIVSIYFSIYIDMM